MGVMRAIWYRTLLRVFKVTYYNHGAGILMWNKFDSGIQVKGKTVLRIMWSADIDTTPVVEDNIERANWLIQPLLRKVYSELYPKATIMLEMQRALNGLSGSRERQADPPAGLQ